MEQSLSEASAKGDINALYAAVASDPTILDRIDSSPFINTPLHIAASAGQTYFALEMMILKPSLGRKLNHNGSTPMHLALMKKESSEELALGFLSMDKELARVKGREGITPLHCAVTGGRSEALLKKMVHHCPESVMDVTTKGETALHLCAKSDSDCYKAFKFLVQFIESSKMDEIFSWPDSDGCSILHRLITRGRYKMIKCLFRQYNYVGHLIGVNDEYDDLTALDLIKSLPINANNLKIRSILLWSGALGRQAGIFRVFRIYTLCRMFPSRMKYQLTRKTTTHTRESTLVVIVLIIAAMFQVGLNPPGGFWQENKEATKKEKQQIAGSPILASRDLALYTLYVLFISVGLLIALLMTKALTRRMPMAGWLQVSLLFLYSCYLLTLAQPVDEGLYYKRRIILALFSIYFIDYMDLRTIKKFVKRIFRSIRRN